MQCAEAGIKPKEFEENDMRDNFIMLEGYQRRIQITWEQTRALAYNIGRFGNSDAKRYPKTPQQFWGFSWDEDAKPVQKKGVREQWEENQKLLEEAKKRLQNKLPAEVLALQQNA